MSPHGIQNYILMQSALIMLNIMFLPTMNIWIVLFPTLLLSLYYILMVIGFIILGLLMVGAYLEDKLL